ncbi:MAG: AAA family ATPase [Spirochaetales bacterium]|nr:AAA family ATPase [Spirochaetales bacterium]
MVDGKYELNITYPVDAIYSKPVLEIDNDNIFIKALPDKLTKSEISEYYYEKFPIKPSVDEDPFVQEEEIHLMEGMRLPLKPVYMLESVFRNILTTSYRKRLNNLISSGKEVVINNEILTQSQIINVMTSGDGHTGAALLGIGGCGKTCAVNKLLARYPQTLIHHNNKNTVIQIVWLYVQPSSNSDLSALMDGIGDAIDCALGNQKSIYGRYIRDQKKLGSKADKIAEIFRLFNVGILIIDEIQRFNSFKNKTDSYETIMTMTNKSKVGLLVVGTEEAYGRFFTRYYIARRMGTPIKASSYCVDYDYFKQIAGLVMSIQWFKEYQPLTDEIFDAMYNETSGIIERIISVWINVQLDYISLPDKAKSSFKLTPDLIRTCSTNSNPLLGLYAKQTLKEDLLSAADMEGEGVKKSVTTKNTTCTSLKEFCSSKNPLLAQDVFTRVKNNLLEAGETFPDDFILENTNKVIGLKTSINRTEDELVEVVIKRVRKNQKKLINTKAIEHNNEVRLKGIQTVNLAEF